MPKRDKDSIVPISLPLISQLNGLFQSVYYRWMSTSKMLVTGDNIGIQCPMTGYCEEAGWSLPYPMREQWPKNVASNICGYGYYEPSYQECWSSRYGQDVTRQVHFPRYYHQPQQLPQPCAVPSFVPSVVPNLPCQSTPQWDYNSMCYNVNGQPCQYTNVVDLEDFMNNEKRKEKSRVAARCRRTKEMQIFTELTEAIPARREEVEQLDKASVMRLAISYLRVRDVVSLLPESEPEQLKPKGLEEVSSEQSYMKALDGFVLVISQQGDIVYCSENISDHLGVSQMEIMGQSVFDFSHPCDHDEVREALRCAGAGRRELLLRMKCTLTSKGRNVHLKSATYKVVHITGHMLTPSDIKQDEGDKKCEDSKKLLNGTLVAVGRPIPHPSNIEIPLDSKTFLSKHTLDMKFTYTDKSLSASLGYSPSELMGKSLYECHHAADSAALAVQFKSLFSKGQCETGQYRFLAKTGGYAWVQTQATVITDKQQKPVSIVCVNFVISGIEFRDEVFAAHQLLHADLKPVVANHIPVPVACPPLVAPYLPNGAIVSTIIPEKEGPTPVTESIFAPRKKEMNKGFLIFSQDEGQTMLKDEPEDLTHLAPTAGDACIPLETHFDVFADLLNDNYCSLLSEDLANGSPVESLLSLSSPDPQENESSCEQSSFLTELSLDTFDSPENDIDDGNSPYIPMSDELPESAVMWGALPDSVSLAKPQPTEPHLGAQTEAPALQRLLAAPTGPPPQDLITNIYSDQGLISSKNVQVWDTGVKRVLKQEEEPSAKRVKRSPSPVVVQRQTPPKQSSSVLMNLLDVQRQAEGQQRTNIIRYQHVSQKLATQITSQLPAVNVIQFQGKRPNPNIIRNMPSNCMTPLSLNVSPMYSLQSSPNYSPAISPALDTSAYLTPQSLSPIGPSKLLSPGSVLNGSDPYLSNKMQPSPNYGLHSPPDLLMDNMSPDFDWGADADLLAGANELSIAFDDVKLNN